MTSYGDELFAKHLTSDSVKTVGLNVKLGTAPASAGAAGSPGDVIVTATYIYVCTAATSWVRVQLATW